MAWRNGDPVHWRKYESLGFNVMMGESKVTTHTQLPKLTLYVNDYNICYIRGDIIPRLAQTNQQGTGSIQRQSFHE